MEAVGDEREGAVLGLLERLVVHAPVDEHVAGEAERVVLHVGRERDARSARHHVDVNGDRARGLVAQGGETVRDVRRDLRTERVIGIDRDEGPKVTAHPVVVAEGLVHQGAGLQ